MKKVIKLIVENVLVAFYVAVGIFTITHAATQNEYAANILGIIVVLTSLVHVALYFLKAGWKNPSKGFYLVIGIVGVGLGFVFMFSEHIDIINICIFWGILDMIRAALEIKDVIPELKEEKLEIIPLLVSIGDFILGILLCIHGEEGIAVHLIYLGSAFILTAVKFVVEMIIEGKEEKKEKQIA